MNDIQFFKKYQKQLVWFINTKIGRWFFKVDEDIKDICNVAPNSLTYDKHLERQESGEWREVKTTCFRTNNKYARLLNYRLAPLHKLAYILPSLLKPEFSPLFVPVMLTVDIYYPGSTSQNNPVDGMVNHALTNQTWSTIRDGAGNGCNYSLNEEYIIQISSGSSAWNEIKRFICLFDTSSIPDDDVISSATLSIYITENYNNSSWTPNLNVFSSNPASNTSLTNGDFDSLGTTAFATAISYENINASGYNDFTLNASGIAAISKTGISKFGLRNANYDAANSAPTWAASKSWVITARTSKYSDTSSDPKLTVTHSAVITFIPQIIFTN